MGARRWERKGHRSHREDRGRRGSRASLDLAHLGEGDEERAEDDVSFWELQKGRKREEEEGEGKCTRKGLTFV
jgi:hypothetical protein